jgi:hypothetical protein
MSVLFYPNVAPVLFGMFHLLFRREFEQRFAILDSGRQHLKHKRTNLLIAILPKLASRPRLGFCLDPG